MKISNLWYNTMSRLRYVLITALQLAVAYFLLRMVLIRRDGEMLLFPSGWEFLDPLALIVSDGDRLWLTLLIHAALTIGLCVISVQRARDAGWHPFIGYLMILPVVRLFVFTALAVAPAARRTEALELPGSDLFDRIMPTSRTGSAVAAIMITLLLVMPLAMFGVDILQQYGLALFIGLPFIMGLVSTFLYNYHEPRSLNSSARIALYTMTIALVLALVLAMEGLLCILMAAPILYIIAFVGAIIGHALGQNDRGRGPGVAVLILVVPGMMAFEVIQERRQALYPVVTMIEIDATPEVVWDALIAFSRIDEPEELLFKAGISYPIEARIEGQGVGAIRYCEFNTGPFVEPITVWNEPVVLAFDVLEDPPPMSELTFYDQIDAPHVDGFFRSRKGQFHLVDIGDGRTLLEGTTWYTHDIWPNWYWKQWSDMILHKIHHRVLAHIKRKSEALSK